MVLHAPNSPAKGTPLSLIHIYRTRIGGAGFVRLQGHKILLHSGLYRSSSFLLRRHRRSLHHRAFRRRFCCPALHGLLPQMQQSLRGGHRRCQKGRQHQRGAADVYKRQLRYAENPPKKYQDIVNVAFYGPAPKRARKLGLWLSLIHI